MNNFVNNDEKQLVRWLQDDTIPIQQKEKLFEQIVNKYKEKIFNMVYNYLKPNVTVEDVEDIVIDSFFKFYKNIKNFKHKCSIETYLRRIAVNLTINFLKSKDRNSVVFLEETTLEEEKETTTYDVEKEEIKKIFFSILNMLPHKQKIAFQLAYYENLSYKEIAEIMLTTVSSVESLLFRAKQNIKKYIVKNKELSKKLGLDI